MNSKIKIGITHGDTNGVGYEVILKAFENPTIYDLCTPIIYGSPRVATFHRKAMDLNTNFTTIASAQEAQEGCLNMVDVFADRDVKVEFGTASPEGGAAALESLEAAMTDYKRGLIDILVTAPINKHSIQSENFHFPGHTEYIESCVGEGQKAMMMLVSPALRVALATTHLSLSQVAASLTTSDITLKIHTLHLSLKRDFGISMPRIAVLSLNPHAGEQGLIGHEENDIISPAIRQAQHDGIHCFGPYPADGFFGSTAYTHFDAVLAMYHDQGLVPFKLLSMENGVNFTAGLPIVRTSPDHGTAYDIAGKGQASPQSFLSAIYTALDVYRARNFYDEARENPLPKLYKGKDEDRRRPHAE